jgi:hypothetical protein
MTREDDFIGQLEGYLDDYEGLTPLPDATRDAIRAQLPKTRQIGSFRGPMRYLSMSMSIPVPARYGVAAAMVVAAAVLGGALFVGGRNNPGGPGPTASPSPTPGPPVNVHGVLEPGTYRVTPGAVSATLTVPAGWSGGGLDPNVSKGDGPTSMFVGFWPLDEDFATVYADPCHWEGNVVTPPVGPTVDDLADALAAQADRGDALPTDVTVDGYHGKFLELSVPSGIDFADCDQGEFRSWFGRFHQGPGQIDRIYILDVDGQRAVYFGSFLPEVSAADQAELQSILDSVHILP